MMTAVETGRAVEARGSLPSPLRLCIVGDAIQYHLRRWSQYFAAHGHHVDVVTFNPDVLPDYGDVAVHVVRKPWRTSRLAQRALSAGPVLWNLRRALEEIQPDVVHVFSATWYAILAMSVWGGPSLITPLGSDVLIDLDESRVERTLVRWALRRASLVHSDGYNVREVLLKTLRIESDRIVMATYGVDVDKFRPAAVERKPADPVTVVSTRRLDPVHDVGTLIRAIPGVVRRFPHTRFVVAGPGSEFSCLQGLARTLGVDRHVTFRGRVEEHEMAQLLQSADIYVATSLSESGLAASTAEAMASEVAVINTDTGDIRSWIDDGRSGFIIPPRRPDILAMRIIHLIERPDRRAAFAATTRARIVERNNYRTQMHFMGDVYASLARKHS